MIYGKQKGQEAFAVMRVEQKFISELTDRLIHSFEIRGREVAFLRPLLEKELERILDCKGGLLDQYQNYCEATLLRRLNYRLGFDNVTPDANSFVEFSEEEFVERVKKKYGGKEEGVQGNSGVENCVCGSFLKITR